MRYLPLILLATPAAAHDGMHQHPHGIEGLILLAALAGIAALVLSRR